MAIIIYVARWLANDLHGKVRQDNAAVVILIIDGQHKLLKVGYGRMTALRGTQVVLMEIVGVPNPDILDFVMFDLVGLIK